MFNRVLLILLCTLSLGWIFYVGYDVFYKTDRLNPELVFTAEDNELLIINRTDEFFETEIPFVIPNEIHDLVKKFIENPRNERIYIAKKRAILLIESPHYWNYNSVITYLKRKGINYTERDKQIFIDSFKIQFKYHFMLIAPTGFERQNKELALPSWDKKATAVLVHHLGKSAFLTEIYKRDNGQIEYLTQFENKVKSQKADDKIVFAPYLPADLTSYHFYETNYALEQHILPTTSPMNDWLHYGFVVFSYQGNTAIMCDTKLGEDPINTFNTKYAKDTVLYSENTLIKNIKLIETFPLNSAKGFYLTRIGDKIVFSESLDLNKKILADYELGNTLLLNTAKATSIYGLLPAKVSERLISKSERFAISMYANVSTKYLVQTNKESKAQTEEVVKEKSLEHYIITIDGTIAQVYGKGNQQYFLTTTNHLFAVNNGKTAWNLPLNAPIIGSIKPIDFDGTGKTYLLFNTADKLYILNEQGVNVLENKILPKVSFLNEMNFYNWKNQPEIIYTDEIGKIKVYSINQNTTKTVATKAGTTQKPIEVFIQNNRPIGVYVGNKETQTIDLNKLKVAKTYPVIPTTALRLNTGGIPAFMYQQKEELVKLDYASGKVNFGTFNAIQKLKIISIEKRNFISFISTDKLYVFDENGGLFKQIQMPISDVVDYDITIKNGNLFIAFLDGLENKVVICDAKGGILRRDLEGKNTVFISSKGIALNVLSEGNGYAVQYYDVLKK